MGDGGEDALAAAKESNLAGPPILVSAGLAPHVEGGTIGPSERTTGRKGKHRISMHDDSASQTVECCPRSLEIVYVLLLRESAVAIRCGTRAFLHFSQNLRWP